MTVDFFTNNSDANTLEKSFTAGTTKTGNLKEPCSIEAPEITFSNSGVIPYNYCYIPAFGRYYYIVDQTLLSNNRVRLSLKVDVLESFKENIKALNAIIEVSTNSNNKYLPSPLWVSTVKCKTDIVTFPSGLNDDGAFILITAGG